MRTMVAVAVLALVVAACGSDSDQSSGVASADDLVTATTGSGGATGDVASIDGESSTTTAVALDAEEAILAFTECMREEGVEINDPEVDAEGNLRLNFRGLVEGEVDREALEAARAACGDLLEGAVQRFATIDRTEIEDTLVEFAACMRDNGYDMPDPDLTFTPGPGGGGGGGRFGDIDPDDPEFQDALEACEYVFGDLPFRPGGGGPQPGRGEG